MNGFASLKLEMTVTVCLKNISVLHLDIFFKASHFIQDSRAINIFHSKVNFFYSITKKTNVNIS